MKEFLRKYKMSVLAIVGTLILGCAAVFIWATIRQQVTPTEVERARTNCVEWIDVYGGENIDMSQSVIICQTAENADPRSFYFRWVPGQYGKIDPPKAEDVPSAEDAGVDWWPEGAG